MKNKAEKHNVWIGRIVFSISVSLLAVLSGCGSAGSSPPAAGSSAPLKEIRLGYYANLTHAQAVVGVVRGDFQKAFGDVKINTAVFNAGPSAIEALFAGEIDITYVGPSPAINGYLKSKGKALRIIAGSANNGVCIVARPGSGIKTVQDLSGKRIATPQFGNTQDISARHFVLAQLKGKLKENGGDTEILNVANAEQIGLFKQGELDASWAPEPWAARLVHDAGGVIIEEEKNLWSEKSFASTLVVVSTNFLQQHPEAVETFLRTHVALTDWVKAHQDEAAGLVNEELKKLLGKALKPEVLKDAFSRIEFNVEAPIESVRRYAEWGHDLKLNKEKLEANGMFSLDILNKVNATKK
jgi:NitT/TauT family transport system substrate-binding protein